MDKFDRAILDILRKNNRTPQRHIAERVNLSTASVQRRIAAMEADGTILANIAVVSPEIDGPAVTIVVEVHLIDDRSSTYGPTKKLFKSRHEVKQCYHVTGNGGLILILSVRDMKSYEALSRELFADNELVSTFRTLVVLDTVKCESFPIRE